MSPASVPEPVFPGGRERAPEATDSPCSNPACACVAARGGIHCCRACAKAPDDAPACPCGHYGCAARPW
jgi:hypothetical protein